MIKKKKMAKRVDSSAPTAASPRNGGQRREKKKIPTEFGLTPISGAFVRDWFLVEVQGVDVH